MKYEDIFREKVVFKRFLVDKDLNLIPCNYSINPYTLVFKTKNEKSINTNDLKKFIGCLIDISRTPINQDIEVYKLLV